ncbi:VanZ family protein [Flavobacterium sp. ACAM 123]|uniref:VanZ family protein n=1 Tax=Flavobacterium sp. ACAM 123 TaxID=1189620 RepID=UPI000318C9F1|nr:VanZ family protein [Flavobacterium sp. ACAM 123]
MLKQIVFWIALFWTGVILFLSLVQSDELPAVNIENLDKVVHAFFHFVFTSLWILFFKTQIKDPDSYKPYIISFLFSVLFGVTVEMLQGQYTTTRKEDALDVAANMVGAALAVFSIILYFKNRCSNKS